MGILKIAQFAESKISAISRIMGIIAIAVLVAMMLFTVANVILRAFFNSPIPGDVELIEIAMVCTSFLALGWCAIKGRHIKVDLVVSFLPKRLQRIIDSFGYLIGLATCFIIAQQSIMEGLAHREGNYMSASLGIPVYPFYWITALGFAILCLTILVLLVRSLTEAIKK
ncbi:TRAP transporter small permease [Deltaproteobacteria bacterium]|nr:TRAP transporter small permease [Deltaproteobacteria bacterium]